MRRPVIAGVAVVVVGLLLAPGSRATFPGRNGNVIFLSDRARRGIELWVADSTGKSRRNLKIGASSASWSPNGRRIAFGHQGEIYTVKPDGRQLRRLTRNRVQDSYPTWSPDGKRILFASRGGLYVVRATGGGRRRLTRPEMCVGQPSWSARGRRIAFADYCAEPDPLIYLISADGRGLRSIGAGDNPDFSPDGTELVIERHGRVEIIALDESNRRVVTVGSDPVWSPDGRRIAFTRQETSVCGANQLVIRVLSVAADGSDEEEVTPRQSTGLCDFHDSSPGWQARR